MVKHTKKFAPSKLDSPQVALSWFELGILPVPLQPASKRPVSQKGWNTLRVTRETIPDFFQKGQNVGGLWGEPSGWIVDIDLDCPEAVAVAPLILPETFVYGRKSVPHSHYLFRCEGIPTTKFFEKDEGMLLEIRSTGSQSVLPPSIHPDKERYEINRDVPFKTLTRSQLEEFCRHIASASLLVRYYPKDHGRHDYVHAITGTLLWGGWGEERTKAFLGAIFAGASDREDDRRQRERTVENTIEHFRKKDKIAGWKTLSQWLPGHILTLVKNWLVQKASSEPAPDTIPDEDGYKFDPRLLEVPGIVGEITKWAASRAQRRQPLFDLAVGLMCTALVTTNKYVVQGWDTPLQPYFMLVAPSSGGKDSALNSVYDFMRRFDLQDYGFQNFQSYHAMLDKLASPPNMACWLLDEAARHLKSLRGSGPDQQVLSWLIRLFGKSNGSSPGVPGRHNPIPPMQHPFFTILAAAQPEALMSAITEMDISTGLVNRFVLFDAGPNPPEQNLDRQHIFPASLEERIRRLRAVETPSGDRPFIQIRFEEASVKAMFKDFDQEAVKNSYEGGGGELWGRANQHALIMAGIVAVGNEPKRPVITEAIALWAIRLSRWAFQQWANRIDESASRTVVEGRSKTVEKYIRAAKSYADRKNLSPTQRRLLTRGMMPRGLLIRLCRHMTSRDLTDILDQLVGSNTIAQSTVDDVDVYWPKRT